MNLDSVYSPVRKDIARVRDELKNQINASLSARKREGSLRKEFIEPLSRHILKGGGKMLRPLILLLSAKAVRRKMLTRKYNLIRLAAAVELVHTASLLHDDVLDNGKMRRHQVTVNAKWGNKTAILFGDYIHSTAFSILIDYPELAGVFSDAVLRMCEGEVAQNLRVNDMNMTEHEYIGIITKKSAILFEASCRIGAAASGASREQEKALSDYGRNLGIAYQIFDDLSDITGKENEVGKSLGSDAAQGKITLPLIYLRDSSSNLFQKQFEIKTEKIINRVSRKICGFLDKAKNALNIIPKSVYRRSLEELLQKFKWGDGVLPHTLPAGRQGQGQYNKITEVKNGRNREKNIGET